MKKIVKNIFPAIYLVVIAFSAASCNKTQAAPAAAPGQPVDLTYAAEKSLPSVVYIKSVTNSKVQTVEYSETPLGLDVRQPRFGWQMQSDRQGARQTAYQLVVQDESGTTVWDSGRCEGYGSQGIKYAGRPLTASTRYDWTLTVWDDNGGQQQKTSWFETGLFSERDTDPIWEGAAWIGGDEHARAFYGQYLPVFRICYDVRMEKGCRSASFLYGANDHRLMDANKNILGVENAKDASFIRIELTDKQLNVYRVGYKATDKADQPIKTFKLKDFDPAATHHIEIASLSGTTDIELDGGKIGSVELNSIGRGGIGCSMAGK